MHVQIPTLSCTSTKHKESLQNAGRKCINLDSLVLEKCGLFISCIIIRKLLFCDTFWTIMNTLRTSKIPWYLSSLLQHKVSNRNIISEKDFVSYFINVLCTQRNSFKLWGKLGEIHIAFSWHKSKAWTLAANREMFVNRIPKAQRVFAQNLVRLKMKTTISHIKQ